MSHTIRDRIKWPARIRAPRLCTPSRMLILETLEARTVPSFLPPTYYAAGPEPSTVAVGDFNGDKLLDLAAADRFVIDSWTRVWLGNGDGTLRIPPATPFLGPHQTSLVVGDFNGDDQLDLAIATASRNHGGGRGVHVLLGRGDGTFQPARSRDPGGEPWSLAAGDFNSDGQLDLAVTISYPGPTGVRVLLGKGDGTFTLQPIHNLPRFSTSVAVADFNGDDQLDVVMVSPELFGRRGEVLVLGGNGDGTFQDAVPFEAGRDPRSVVVADFNGDGQDDLAVRNFAAFLPDDGSVSVLLGNGDGSFQQAVHYATGNYSYAIAVGDFNRDCIPDLAAGYQPGAGDNLVRIFLGRGDGTFQDAGSYRVDRDPPWSIAVGDFNGDYYPDLATANYGSGRVGLLLNAADWVDPSYSPCDPARAPAPAPTPGAPGDLWAAIAASLTTPTPAPRPAPPSLNIIPGYTGEIVFWSTDPLPTTPKYYQFQRTDWGVAYFPGGLTFNTPGVQQLYVFDWPGVQVFGYAAFEVV